MNQMYLRRPMIPNVTFDNSDRFFPLFFPFLGGALLGGAAVAISRPRPIIGYPYMPYPTGPYGYRPFY